MSSYPAFVCGGAVRDGQSYHWSLTQVEYATDLAFRSTTTLGPLYEQLVRQSMLSVKAEQVASFLGRHISPQLAQESGARFSTRIEGTCIRHRFGKSSIKMYDKCGSVLRIETTPTTCHFSSTTARACPCEGGGATPGRTTDPRTGSRQEKHL